MAAEITKKALHEQLVQLNKDLSSYGAKVKFTLTLEELQKMAWHKTAPGYFLAPLPTPITTAVIPVEDLHPQLLLITRDTKAGLTFGVPVWKRTGLVLTQLQMRHDERTFALSFPDPVLQRLFANGKRKEAWPPRPTVADVREAVGACFGIQQ